MSFRARVPESRCLGCGRLTDGVTNPLADDGPDPGDITICLYCGHVMAFAADLTVRELTSEEIHAVAGDPTVLRMQRARAAVMKDRNSPKGGSGL